MRTREKILLLLFTVTVVLGAVVYMQSRHDEMPLMRFRWFVLNHPLRNLSAVANSFAEWSSENGNATVLGYGALSLLALVTVGIAFGSARNAELRAFRDRLVETQVAKTESEALLQDAMWKEKNARAAREAALKELEESSNRILALEDRLTATERLLKRRDAELKVLQSRQTAASESPLDKSSVSTPDHGALKEDLRKTTELLKSKESALAELEKSFTDRIDTLESQLKLSEKLRKEHYNELEALRAELLRAQAAEHETESLLAEELNKEKQASIAKDAAMKDTERNLSAKIRALEIQVSDDHELLQSRGTEVEALKAELHVVTGQLRNVTAAKEHADHLLQQELHQKIELLQSKDKAFKELQERSRAKVQSLEARLADQERLRQDCDQELAALRNRLSEAGAIKNRAEASLAEELQTERRGLAAKDAAMKEMERNLLAKIDSLNLQLRDKQEVWESRTTELEAFKSETNVLTARLAEMASAKERVETSLQQELKNRADALQRKDVALKEAQAKLTATVRALEGQITEKDAVLAQRQAELNALESQLTDAQSSGRQRQELLRQELKEKTEILRAKDLTTKELEESLAEVAAAAKKEISERDKLLKTRDAELEKLRFEVSALNAQLHKPHDQAANEALNKNLAESSKKILALESSLREKEDLLKTHDGKIERLEGELKDKRTELAKHEIAVWQAYERRALWKQRLAKFGISIKDS